MFETTLFVLLNTPGVTVVIDGYDIETINDYGVDSTGAAILVCDCDEDNRWYFADQPVQVTNGSCKAMSAPEGWGCGQGAFEATLELSVKRPLQASDLPGNPQNALPTIVVEMNSGAIHCVRSSVPARVILLDEDIEGSDGERIQEVNGEDVYVHHYPLRKSVNDGSPGVDPVFVEDVARQILTEDAAMICDECGAHVESVLGCPDGAEICQQCFNNGSH